MYYVCIFGCKSGIEMFEQNVYLDRIDGCDWWRIEILLTYEGYSCIALQRFGIRRLIARQLQPWYL